MKHYAVFNGKASRFSFLIVQPGPMAAHFHSPVRNILIVHMLVQKIIPAKYLLGIDGQHIDLQTFAYQSKATFELFKLMKF